MYVCLKKLHIMIDAMLICHVKKLIWHGIDLTKDRWKEKNNTIETFQ